MKKFSTATLILALTCHGARAAPCEFREQAPGQHVVKTGDTLWDIASAFLKNPWCWPQVWDNNRDQIRDPHWIFPGQTIYFDRVRGRLSLTSPDFNDPRDTTPAHRLAPRIRTLLPAPVAVASPLSQASLRVQSILVDDIALRKAPSVVVIKDGRKMAGKHDRIFVRGELGHLTEFMVLRGSERIIDPQTKASLAVASRRVATVRLLEAGSTDGLHHFAVTTSDAELEPGDRLLPEMDVGEITPHAAVPVSGQLASVLQGSLWASTHDVVAINRGKQHGLEKGSLLSVMKGEKAGVPIPGRGEHIASLLVFDVGDSVALASVMYASDALSVGDAVGSGTPADR